MVRQEVGNLSDLPPDSQEYWEQVLAQQGLTMRRGSSPKLVYVGDSHDLEKLASGTHEVKALPKRRYGTVVKKDR